jgi:hypothetical protein
MILRSMSNLSLKHMLHSPYEKEYGRKDDTSLEKLNNKVN